MEIHSEIPVYNYIYDKNNLTWGKYMHFVRKGLHQPLDKAVWYDNESKYNALKMLLMWHPSSFIFIWFFFDE